MRSRAVAIITISGGLPLMRAAPMPVTDAFPVATLTLPRWGLVLALTRFGRNKSVTY